VENVPTLDKHERHMLRFTEIEKEKFNKENQMDYNGFAEELREVLQNAEEQVKELGYRRDDIEDVISNIEDANSSLENALDYIDNAVESANRLAEEYIPQAQDILGY